MCKGGFLKKNEGEGWLLYEELADKTIQWEPTPKKFRTNNSSSSKVLAQRLRSCFCVLMITKHMKLFGTNQVQEYISGFKKI